MITTLTDERVSILIRGCLFKISLFGRSLRACGHIPVTPGGGQRAFEEARELLQAGRTVVVFPEGEISPPEGGFHRPHTGLARLALSTGAPVVPVGIHLDQRQLHRIETHIEDKMETGAWYFHGPYAITVGEAMTFTGAVEDRERVRQVSEQVMRRIVLLSGESAQRIRTDHRLDWLGATRWWLGSPLRLVRYWSAFEGVKIQ